MTNTTMENQIKEILKNLDGNHEIGVYHRLVVPAVVSQLMELFKRRMIESVDEVKVTEQPDEKEFGNLSKGQIFLSGQINILLALKMKLEKEGGKE